MYADGFLVQAKHLQLSTWELPLALAHGVDQQSGEMTPPGVALSQW